MSYQVNLPVGKVIQYPDLCPFSGAQSPDGFVRLKWTSTSTVTPLPDGFRNSYTIAELKIPSRRSTAVLARVLGGSVWISLLGGLTACVILIQSDTMSRHAVSAIIAGLALASLCRFLRFWVLRKFRIKGVWGEFLKLRISSEQYAREFAELNRLSVEAA
jgi:hypothetical protein